MAGKTWVPGLILALKVSKHYMTRWNTQLSVSLTAPQYTCMTSTLNAILACLALLGSE